MAFRGGVGSDPTGSGPLYPEGRKCRRPTARRLIDLLFDDVQRHSLRAGRRPPVVFTTELSRLLRLLGMTGLPRSCTTSVVAERSHA
jgi:hypothetical protein